MSLEAPSDLSKLKAPARWSNNKDLAPATTIFKVRCMKRYPLNARASLTYQVLHSQSRIKCSQNVARTAGGPWVVTELVTCM